LPGFARATVGGCPIWLFVLDSPRPRARTPESASWSPIGISPKTRCSVVRPSSHGPDWGGGAVDETIRPYLNGTAAIWPIIAKAWARNGGRASPPGIKPRFCSKILAVQIVGHGLGDPRLWFDDRRRGRGARGAALPIPLDVGLRKSLRTEESFPQDRV